MKRCRCRNCGKIYSEDKATADWKGYCTQACVHEKSHTLGYRKPTGRSKFGMTTEYDVLSKAGKIGSVYVDSEGCVI